MRELLRFRHNWIRLYGFLLTICLHFYVTSVISIPYSIDTDRYICPHFNNSFSFYFLFPKRKNPDSHPGFFFFLSFCEKAIANMHKKEYTVI